MNVLNWPGGKESASWAADLAIHFFAVGLFLGRVIPVTSKLVLQWLTCKTPDIIGSNVGPGRPGVSTL